MSDFTAEELFEAIDRVIAELLDGQGLERPPLDAIALAQDVFDLTVREEDEEDEVRVGRFGPIAPRRRGREIRLRVDQSEEARQAIAARACAREMLPAILTRLGITPGTENRSAQGQLVGLVASRLLLPTRWFAKDARRTGYDLEALKAIYSTAGYEMIALRFLDLEEPCVVAVVDDGAVSVRRGNQFPATKTLTAAERKCLEMVGKAREVQTARQDGWTSRGWPVAGGPFNRIILRSVADEI